MVTKVGGGICMFCISILTSLGILSDHLPDCPNDTILKSYFSSWYLSYLVFLSLHCGTDSRESYDSAPFFLPFISISIYEVMNLYILI